MTYNERMRPYAAQYAEAMEFFLSGKQDVSVEQMPAYFLKTSETKAKLKQIREGVNSINPGWWPDQRAFSASFIETLGLIIRWSSELEEANDKMRTINAAELGRRQAGGDLERAIVDAATGSDAAFAHAASSKAVADVRQAALVASIKDFNDWKQQKASSWSYYREKLWKSHDNITEMIKERFGINIAKLPAS